MDNSLATIAGIATVVTNSEVTHDFPKQEQKAMNYCPLSVATLALLWFGAAHAQTENTTSTGPAHNRYLGLNVGQQQRNYRELDTQGFTTNGILAAGICGNNA